MFPDPESNLNKKPRSPDTIESSIAKLLNIEKSSSIVVILFINANSYINPFCINIFVLNENPELELELLFELKLDLELD